MANLPAATVSISPQTCTPQTGQTTGQTIGQVAGNAVSTSGGTDAAGDFVAMFAALMSAEAAVTGVPETVAETLVEDDVDDEGDALAEALLSAETAVPVVPLPPRSDTASSMSVKADSAAAKNLELIVGFPPKDESTDNEGPEAAKLSSPQISHADLKTDASAFASSLASLQTRSDEPVERLQVRAHVGTPAWKDEVAARLTYMVERGVQSASLRLSPEHLGPLEIRISINNDQTTVWFGAAHAETRAALEQALPRLREMFASQGLNLSDAGVFRQSPQQQSKYYASSASDASSRGAEREIDIVAGVPRGVVDAYA
jgi:flagellar hook-length control protein FliK